LGDGEQDAAVATAGVDVVVGLGDVVQRVTVADGDGEGADGSGGGEVPGSLALGVDAGGDGHRRRHRGRAVHHAGNPRR
jgi:hypothetical protein